MVIISNVKRQTSIIRDEAEDLSPFYPGIRWYCPLGHLLEETNPDARGVSSSNGVVGSSSRGMLHFRKVLPRNSWRMACRVWVCMPPVVHVRVWIGKRTV